MALTALWARGALKFVVSQNCDGLHVRAGLPRRALAELHGDMFAERCGACRAVYLRACDVTQRTARHRHGTRRLCHACGAELHDTIVHFGERGRAAWPLNWAGALRHAARADVVLCLGSSLKVLRRYARLWRMQAPPGARPRLYIVNLQWTPKDAGAILKINARTDDVMRVVARRLRLRVPMYEPAHDPLLAHAEPLTPPELHTTSRPLLSPPPPPSPAAAHWGGSRSPSPSDSDEELPLRRLADRLRAGDGDALTSFQVSMAAGDATIMLRVKHAPRPPSPPTPPRATCSPLRGVRIARHSATPCLPVLTKREMPALIPLCLPAPRPPGSALNGLADVKSEEEDDLRSLAAAFLARALLLCRAELYPGLHTIVGSARTPPAPSASPSPPPAPLEEEVAAQCAWCWRVRGARRCLWYGPPRRTPLAERAWRRAGARRFLCACCPRGGGGGGEDATDADGGGWYGKGYRKGRRRR